MFTGMTTATCPRLGDVLRAKRLERLMTQVELAELLDIPQGLVSRWERNGGSPSYSNLLRIAVALDLDLGDLDNLKVAA